MYRFKNEYRLFTIVRYNYGYYNTPAKPNMHARISYCKSRLRLIPATFREEGKATRKVEKLEGRRLTGGKKARKE